MGDGARLAAGGRRGTGMMWRDHNDAETLLRRSIQHFETTQLYVPPEEFACTAAGARAGAYEPRADDDGVVSVVDQLVGL